MFSIIPILAVRNRRDSSVECVSRILSMAEECGIGRIVILDDGSNDGTPDALKALSPIVEVVHGDGNLYWAGGMAVAEERALTHEPDLLLWVNDDALLTPTAIRDLVETYDRQGDRRTICVGTMVDPEDGGLVTYSGLRHAVGVGLQLRRLQAVDHVDREVETFNGNLVIVPAETARLLGGIETAFGHHYADWDYGLRAGAMGIPVVAGAGFHGTTARNIKAATYEDRRLPLVTRIRLARQPKGLPPSSHARMLRRHGGRFWAAQWLWAYIKIVMPTRSGK